MTFIAIIYEFFKIGLFSVGGGLATLPFLFELSEKYSTWFSKEELTRMIAVAESTPGPIGINMATYVGFKAGGVLGGIASTLALITPSIIVIIIIAGILNKFKDSLVVKDTFYGLRAAVSGLVAASVLGVIIQNLFLGNAAGLFGFIDLKKGVVFLVILALVFKFKKHPLLYIALGAILGVLIKL